MKLRPGWPWTSQPPVGVQPKANPPAALINFVSPPWQNVGSATKGQYWVPSSGSLIPKASLAGVGVTMTSGGATLGGFVEFGRPLAGEPAWFAAVFTYAAYSSSGSSLNTIAGYTDGSASLGFAFHHLSSELLNVEYTNGRIDTSLTMVPGRVYHALVGRDGAGNVEVWVNGVRVGATTGATGNLAGSAKLCVLYDLDTSRHSNANVAMVAFGRDNALPRARELSLNLWQLYAPLPRRIWAPAGGGGNTFTITPSGGVTLSGAAALLRTRVQVASGGITFSGAAPQLRTRAQIPTGGVILSGTAPVTFVPVSGTIYTITPSGGVTFSGAAAQLRERVQVPAGGIILSGAVSMLRTRSIVPAGGIVFSGEALQIREHISIPVGGVTFSGTAGIIFIPAGGLPSVAENRISIGVSRAIRVS